MISIYNKGITEQLCSNYCDGYLERGELIIGMFNWIKNRIQTELVNNLSKYVVDNRQNKSQINAINALLTDDKIKEIITSKPSRLLEIWNNEFKIYENTLISYKYKVKGKPIYLLKRENLLYKIFDYDSFRKCTKKNQMNGFLLSTNLGVESCPYCNRNYTTTHLTLKKKKVFPEFDHFYHKSSYPLLAVSFYNLIPSCNICNTHYKGQKDSCIENIFNPYTEVNKNHFAFKFLPDTLESYYGEDKKFVLDFEYKSNVNEIDAKLEKSMEFFGIKETYEKCHSNLIKEIVNKKLTYSNSYLNVIKDTFGISFEESYRILFETYYEDDKLHKRPFSKLKKDIFDDVNIK